MHRRFLSASLGLLAALWGPSRMAAQESTNVTPAATVIVSATVSAQPVEKPVPAPSLAVPPVAPVAPRVLRLELTVLRFKPFTNELFFHDYKLSGSISSIVETLMGAGRSVDVLYHGTRELLVEAKSTAKFSATETRPVILIGKQGTSPPAIVYGLTMQVEARPEGKDSFALSWDGVMNWLPDLIDRRAPSGPDAAQIMDKAANAAKSLSGLAGKSQAAGIGLAVAELFKEDSANNSAIYELPVLKTVALGGSRVCHGGEAIINATTAEAGAKESQIVFFVLNPALE